MKRIVDIPNRLYKSVQDGTYCGSLYEELKNSTPLTECEDCISRENLQITLFEKCNGNPNYRINYHNLKSLINKMPSVYPKSDLYIKEIDHLHKYITKLETQIIEQVSINSVLEDIKAEVQNEYDKLKNYDDETLEIGERLGLKSALSIIDKHISGKE